MSRTRELERKLRSLHTLDEAVSALRSLAALNFREARAQLSFARGYFEEVTSFVHGSGAAASTGAEDESEDGPPGVLLLTADLGLVGDYATRLVLQAESLLERLESRTLISLGRRGLRRLRARGIAPVVVFPAPTAGRGLAQQLLPVVDRILELRERGELGALWLVSARFAGAGQFRTEARRMLPPDLSSPDMSLREPLHLDTLRAAASPSAPELIESTAVRISPCCSAAHVRAVALREYLAAMLHASLLEALCSEHGKRLVVAENARSWLSDRVAAQRHKLSSLRREQSTQEVFEVVSAARAKLRAELAS